MASLKSFEFDDTIAPETRDNVSRSHPSQAMDSDADDDDMMFDDTNLETPRTVHHTGIRVTNDTSSSFSVRRTTTKVPLASPDAARPARLRHVSTPLSRFRSRNGTPLRQPPVTSGAGSVHQDAGGNGEDDEDDEFDESELILSRKIISDDNKFQPQPPLQRSPLRTATNRFDLPTTSPPANMKLGSLDYLRMPGLPMPPPLPPRQQSGLPRPLRLPQPRNAVSASPSVFNISNPTNANSENAAAVDPPDPADISRAEILERINATIQSIRDRVTTETVAVSAEPQLPASPSTSPLPQPQLKLLLRLPLLLSPRAIAFSRSNDNILKDLDAFLPPPPAALSQTPPHAPSPEDWPASKWFKLRKILDLPHMSAFDVVNNKTIRDAFGVTKRDLAKRVEFLQALKRRARLRPRAIKSATRPKRAVPRSRKAF